MLLGLIRDPSQILSDPLGFMLALLEIVISLAVAITVHEFSHGYIAYKLGDSTAQRSGRLSFNPLAHLDPVGTLMLFLVGFGWGKPVPVNPYYLKYGPRTGMALVGLAGPASNLVFGAAVGAIIMLVPPFPEETILAYIVFYNVLLAVFNFIPIPPLDGSNILMGILPRGLAISYSRIQRWGPAILIMVVLLDQFAHTGILTYVMRYPINFFTRLFMGEALF